MSEKLSDMQGNVRRAMRALYVEVPEAVARDVGAIVFGYTDALEAENAKLRALVAWQTGDPPVDELILAEIEGTDWKEYHAGHVNEDGSLIDTAGDPIGWDFTVITRWLPLKPLIALADEEKG
jgi:hypothetical protein